MPSALLILFRDAREMSAVVKLYSPFRAVGELGSRTH